MISRFLRDESGATAIEYGLIMSLVFLAMVGAVQQFAGSLIDILTANSDAVTEVTGGGGTEPDLPD